MGWSQGKGAVPIWCSYSYSYSASDPQGAEYEHEYEHQMGRIRIRPSVRRGRRGGAPIRPVERDLYGAPILAVAVRTQSSSAQDVVHQVGA